MYLECDCSQISIEEWEKKNERQQTNKLQMVNMPD